jgi:tRNA splicing endonuclease
MTETYDEIKKQYEIVYEKEINRTGITEEQRMFGDMPKRVIVVKIDHVSKYMVYANYHGDEWCVNSGERFVIGELLKERDQYSSCAGFIDKDDYL